MGGGKIAAAVLLLHIAATAPCASAFSLCARLSGHRARTPWASPPCRARAGPRRRGVLWSLRASSGKQEDGDVSDADWRDFRAKLVAQEKGGGQEGAADEWAYNAGNLVEQGSLLMGGSELEFGFGLRQQYFHKCVLLILAHKPDFTRGVIVNRPTNRRTSKGWRVWFGGDVQVE